MPVLDLIRSELTQILIAKGVQIGEIAPETELLGGALDIDSLDLATLIVALEEQTGLTPFANGFVLFHTVGELSQLFGS